ncbi:MULTISPECIES: dynamin family protein [unclassified Sulfurospirillum]|uniref:dynamin family protein n=1 Tax=unclassified Sulfurospirillum TaxID=2618290 RepID=UPI0005023326|nr:MULTISPECIES: dynamin family protein [unclassified Sulfurospirillum]KFL34787.1 dynamin [Sulfurospirillum sp. SCADC]
MHVINDFFLLIWSERLNQQAVFDEKHKRELDQILSTAFDHFCDSAAILLIISPHNCANMARLEEPKTVLKTLFQHTTFSKETIQYAQSQLLGYLIDLGNVQINHAILKRLELLKKEGIISYDALRSLSSILSLIEEKKIEVTALHVKHATPQENYYKTALYRLFVAIENLRQVIELPRLQERLHGIPERLENQRFSIGITGVMNAGKSTMLNALLGQEVLGTSVVPETANLTLIKYAKEPYAVVNFWNAKEWNTIEEGAKSLKSLEAFVKESRAHFGETFNTLITSKGESASIPVESLALYTSAKHSDKKCNLVKSVELYTDLKFVQDGVQIVDTPGLDDPVVQREEITLEYLSECDLMIHLMNAAQAATQKDIDFIIDALLYRNVAQLLIVITRIDAIAEKELQEVIDYTKRSIEARLKEQNRGAKLDEVIAKIVFIPIAGKLALMHKLAQGEEALALGYDMERTGLPLVEAYLEEVLFGSNSQKANLIISSNRKEIESLIVESMASFEQELHYLNISHEEIEQAYAKHQDEKTVMASFLEQIKTSVAQSKEEMEHYFGTLQKFASNQLDKLQNVVKRRITDDVSYEFSKNKKAPKEERIGSMIETAMKDGLVDVVRDYRYEFQKKMQSALEYMDAQYGEFKSDTSAHHFDARAFCEEHLGSLLIFKNSTIVISGVNDAIKKYGKNDLNMLSTSLDTILGTEFLHVKEMLEAKLHTINHELLSSFVSLCEAPARLIEERFSTEEALLEKAMRQMKDATLNREARILEIEEKKRVMGIVLNDLHVTKESK